ncbi:MAG: GGDEF domain-containing protein [bacterium]
MNNPVHSYLVLLEKNSPADIVRELQVLLAAEETVFFNPQQQGELKLAGFGSLDFSEDCCDETRAFFDWWVNEFGRGLKRKHDELTSLLSRSFWERELKDEISFSDISALALLDIDHFKRFNDLYGHQVGDRVLAAVGEQLLAQLPDSSFAIRYGGEELMVIFTKKKAAAAVDILEQFRDRLDSDIIFESQPEIINVSIGFADGEDFSDVDELIRSADMALYESKATGRNRLTRYAPYLNRHREFYIWGIYRYLWGRENRFVAAGSKVFVNKGSNLFLYSWHGNISEKLFPPDKLALPLRSGRSRGNKIFIVDANGELWCLAGSKSFSRLSSDYDPQLIRVAGSGKNILFLAVNNQLYELEAGGLVRKKSLPDNWEQFCLLSGDIYLLRGQRLIKENDLFSGEGQKTPEDVLQLVAADSVIYMLGVSGRIFSYEPRPGRWSRLRFVNSVRQPLNCRELAVYKQNLFIRDRAGRLLFCRTNSKAVPQQMDIFPADRPNRKD